MYNPPSLGGIRPRRFGLVSWSPHVAFAYDLVADLRPRMLVELGTHSGESFFAFCQSVEENRTGTTCYAVDTWKGDPQAGFYPEEVYEDVYRHNQEFYANFSYLVRATFDDALDRFADGSLDLIHFDGLHTYDAVRHDFHTWQRKLSPRGIALFHDIAARHEDFGAWKFWEELRETGQSFEFRHGWGLGVFKPAGGEPVASSLLRSLFGASAGQAENIRSYYLMATDALHQRTRALAVRNGEAVGTPQQIGTGAVALQNSLAAPALLAPNPPQVQIFFPNGDDGFHEENSRYFPLTLNRWERLEVSLPPEWRGQSLRIDPGSGFGLVDVAGVRIVSEVLGEVVWELLGADLAAGVRLAGGVQPVPNGRVLRLFCAGGDPQILLPEIDLRDIDEPLRLEIGIRLRTEPASFGHTLQEWAREVHGVPALRTEIQQLRGELQRERETHHHTLQTVAEWQLAERGTRAELETALGQLHAANQQAVVLVKGLEQAHAHGDERAAVLLAEVEAARTDRDQQTAAFAEQTAASHEAARQHAAILTSEIEAARTHGAEQVAALTAEIENLRRQMLELGNIRTELGDTQTELGGARTEFQVARAHVQELRQQLENQQGELFNAEAELRELQEEKSQAQQDREALQAEVVGLRHELQGLEATIAAAHHRLAATDAALAEALRSGAGDQGRLKSMRRSASWKLTLPLRVAHRAFTGAQTAQQRENLSPAPQPKAGGVTSADGGYRFKLDAPTDWNLPSQQVRLHGWCVPPPGQPVPRLRFRCGERTLEVECSVPRPDVQASFQAGAEWHLCGFDTKIDVPGGPSELLIEVVDGRGQSFPVGRYTVRAPYSAHARHGAPTGDPAEDYVAWIARYDTLSAEDRRQIRAHARTLAYRPLISVVMPVYNAPEEWLVKAIESVRRQLYTHWELCIADDRSPKPHVREVLARYERSDPRIKVCYREQNGHISAASNSALELATGEFVALLDHDDELASHALYAVALELQKHPEADLLYSDEDKIDEEERRFSPYFKPDWNPDLLLGQNFISHLGVYRREVLEAVGGFRVGYEGCQDWDLALRITERISADHIRHIPRVLYHWRAIEGSTARAVEEKDYIVDASRRVLQDHCERTAKDTEILPVPGGHFRVRYRLPRKPPLVSIIIPTHNQFGLLRQGIESLREKTTYPRYEILVVDNRSDDPETLAYLAEIQRRGEARVLLYPQPFNYSAINNFAVSKAEGELVCLLNNDMEVITTGWLEEMVSQALRPEIGAVGAALYYPDDTIQHAGVVLGLGGVAGHLFSRMPRGTDGYFNRARLVQNFSAVTAACLVVRRVIYQEVGGLNETLKVAFNDVDFCLKVRAEGYRNLWTPYAEFYHHESASRGAEDTPEKHRRFVSEVEYMQAHWHELIADDPAYNPNLTINTGDCQYACPPRVEETFGHRASHLR